MAPRLFLSYARVNRAHVEALAADLRDVDCDPFFDELLTGGRSWWEQLCSEIEECDAFLPVISSAYVESRPCALEADYAHRLGKPFLPIALEHVAPELCNQYVAQAQWIGYDSADRKSLFALVRGIRNLPPCPPLPDPALERPPIPISYLTQLKALIESKDALTRGQQILLLSDLKEGLGGPDDAAARVLLRAYHRRHDLIDQVEREIAELLGTGPVIDDRPPGTGGSVPMPPDPKPAELIPEPPRRPLRIGAHAPLVLVGVLVVALAAGGGIYAAARPKHRNPVPPAGTHNQTPVDVPFGGTLTVATKTEPGCFDWIDICAGSLWGSWMAQYQTIPRAFDIVPGPGGVLENRPSKLLTGEPTLSATPVETITYRINPKAVWSDDVPITCDDFVYTADQIAHGTKIYDRTGYTDIARVACPTAAEAVVTYRPGTVFPAWQSLFGGSTGILPSHLLNGKDRHALMKDGYAWSGGPWIAKWTKGARVTLTPNPRYWGDKPHLDGVVFKFEPGTNNELQAVESNDAQAIYPQPQQDVLDAMSGLRGFNTAYNANSASVEALWINNARFPFDDVKVRQAFGYAIDRDAIVKNVFGTLGIDKAANSLNPFAIQPYSDQNAYSAYHLDVAKVASIMSSDGWVRGPDGIWAKGGRTATFTLISTNGSARRRLIEANLQSQLLQAGFKMTYTNVAANDLFTSTMPGGGFAVALYSTPLTGLTPGLCRDFCSANIPAPSSTANPGAFNPSEANPSVGHNWTRTNIPRLNEELTKVDTSLDPSVAVAAAKQADKIMAQEQVSLPLDPLPDILIWNQRVVGPIVDNSILGMFWNINEWGCISSVCT